MMSCNDMYSTEAYAIRNNGGKFEKITIQRNKCGPDDVELDICYCGICHTDVHHALNFTGMTYYPIVPGHEIAGKVIKVGANVKKFKVGDQVGVGSISDSCLSCNMCNKGEEQFCGGIMTDTYNADIEHGHIKTNTNYTLGGYSKKITLNERFVIKIPDAYPMECAGPIFCAGVTTYSSLKHFGAGNGGKRVGVIGIGGLGQMGVRLAAALGNEVTAISSNASKESTARDMGAKHFILTTDRSSMRKGKGSLDLILNTISAPHQVVNFISLLDIDGTIVQLGMVIEPHKVMQNALQYYRNSIAGSIIGSIAESQEVIDFCAREGIKPDIEIITADKLDEIHKKLNEKNDTVKRYVLDVTTSIC